MDQSKATLDILSESIVKKKTKIKQSTRKINQFNFNLYNVYMIDSGYHSASCEMKYKEINNSVP